MPKPPNTGQLWLIVYGTVAALCFVVVVTLCVLSIQAHALQHIKIDTTHWSVDSFIAFTVKCTAVVTPLFALFMLIMNKAYDLKDAAIARARAEQAQAQAQAATAQTIANAQAINNHAEQINGKLTARTVAASSAAVAAALAWMQEHPGDVSGAQQAAEHAAQEAARILENDNPISAVSVRVSVPSNRGVAGNANQNPGRAG